MILKKLRFEVLLGMFIMKKISIPSLTMCENSLMHRSSKNQILVKVLQLHSRPFLIDFKIDKYGPDRVAFETNKSKLKRKDLN